MAEKTTRNTRQEFPLLQELRRWFIYPNWQTSPPRWTVWARALSERHGRVAGRHEALELALVRRLPLMQRVQQRWLVSSQRFFPQINLAIHPILHQMIWREQTLLLPNAKTTETKSVELRRLITRQVIGQPVFLWPAAIPSAASRWTVEKSLHETSDKILHQIFDHALGRALGKRDSQFRIPLQFVFQRLFRSDESILLKRSQSATLTNVGTLVERLMRQSQRVEERAAEAATVVMRRPPVVDRAPAMTGNQQTFVTTVAGQSWQQHTAPPPGINIEQITDRVVRQLDRRVVAARERLGKV